MKKFRVYAMIYVCKEIATIEAESKEEAIKKGWGHENCEVGSLCWQCSNEYELEEIDEVNAEEIMED
jgi:hypothetical protein